MAMGTSRTRRHLLQGFTLLEMLVSMVGLVILVTLLAMLNNSTIQIWKRNSGQSDLFQASRLAFDMLNRHLNQATLNVYWDYDNPNTPTRYLRKSDLAFVSGEASSLLSGVASITPGPGQAMFFQAPLGRLDDPAARQLGLLLNTCGFYIDYGNADLGAPAFMSQPVRNRYRLMQLQTSGEQMKVFDDTDSASPDDTWFTGQLGTSRMLGENIVLLIVRPLAPGPGGTHVDLAGSNYRLDTRGGEDDSPQPATSNQLPPMLDLTLVAVTEDSMKRKDASGGYQFSDSELSPLFVSASSYDDDMTAFTGILVREKLDYRIFRQQIALPNSKWSD